jgi:predicted aldo/keto reductase-like oxidoreductase
MTKETDIAREKHLFEIEKYKQELKDCVKYSPHWNDTQKHLQKLREQLRVYDKIRRY